MPTSATGVCLEGRAGRALEPGETQPPLFLTFSAWREVDGHLVTPFCQVRWFRRPART